MTIDAAITLRGGEWFITHADPKIVALDGSRLIPTGIPAETGPYSARSQIQRHVPGMASAEIAIVTE